VRRVMDLGFGKWLACLVSAGLIGVICWKVTSPNFYLEETLPLYLRSVFMGFFPVFAVCAVIGAVWRICRREWTPGDSMLAVLLLGHALQVCLQILVCDGTLYVAPRYLLPAMPLELGWAIYGVLAFWNLLSSPFRGKYPRLVRGLGILALILTAGGFLLDFYQPVIKLLSEKTRSERQVLEHVARVIRSDYKGTAEVAPAINLAIYIPRRSPGIHFLCYSESRKKIIPDRSRISISAYLAGGRIEIDRDRADYLVERIASWENRKTAPGLELMDAVQWKKDQYRIWRIVK